MSLFSLDWFKSQKRKREEKLLTEVIQTQKELLTELQSRPYRTLKMINDQITVVLNNGDIISKSGATEDDFEKVKTAKNIFEINEIISNKNVIAEEFKKAREYERLKIVAKGIDILKNIPDFEVVDNSVYLKDSNGNVINRSIPQLLVEKFIEITNAYTGHYDTIKEDTIYKSLKKFWLKCCLNPNAKSAEGLYRFLDNNNMKIDKHGNFYAYRRVLSKNEENKELVEFISNTYIKVRSVWKKNPNNYPVWEDREGNLSFSKNSNKDGVNIFHGRLGDLYKSLPSMQNKSYTDSHTRTYDYKVGEVISMPRYEGDDNSNIACSKGFHGANHKLYDYTSFGDTVALMIINPSDVLAVPEAGKLRTCRWFFAAVLDKEEQYILDDPDFDVTDLGDVFEEKCANNLQEYTQNSFAEEVKRHTFTIPQISASEITSIVLSLDEMREILSKRVVKSE